MTRLVQSPYTFVEIILLGVVTATRTWTGIFCRSSAQKEASFQKIASSTTETNQRDKSAGQGARCCLKLGGGGGSDVFSPACTCDISLLDVLVHNVGARAVKIRPANLKES